MNDHYVLERDLTPMETAVLREIEDHPGYTPFDLAEIFDHSVDVYSAIYYLIGSGRADQDKVTGAITAREAA